MFFFFFLRLNNVIMIMVSIMAKRRRSSKKKTSTNSYSPEFVGLILILIGILGLGFGAVGIFIKKLAMYAVGELWLLILMVFIFIGIYTPAGSAAPAGPAQADKKMDKLKSIAHAFFIKISLYFILVITDTLSSLSKSTNVF